jgi:hypothetical protein
MSYNFEYFYGNEAERFMFFRIPKVLITNERFKEVSTDSKLLYGLMLDRMCLSNKNGWFDEQNRVYIIYTIKEIMEDMRCAKQKVAKLLDELENDVGLIERKRQGLRKPNIIYVKNFDCFEEVKEQNVITKESKTAEVRKSNFKKYENQTSGGMKIKLQEVRKSNSNNTNINNTDFNNTISSNHIKDEDKIEDWKRKRKIYKAIIKERIEYDILVEKFGKQWLDNIVHVMVDVACSDKQYIRINKQNYPQEVVKERFFKIDSSHIEYIYDALKNNTSDVRNIRAFLITTIFRAYETSECWYKSKVNYDLSNRRKEKN